MQRLHFILFLASLPCCVGCDRQSDFITETSPFVEVQVPTPPDGKAAVASRAEQFAKQHGMKVHFVPNHFEPHEFSLSLTRADLNIVAANVMLGGRSDVTAYTRSAPTAAQRAEVEAYLCEVMRHRCAA